MKPADDNFVFDKKAVGVAVDGKEITDFTVGDYASKKCVITLNKAIDIRSTVSVEM